jgi:spermidine synthase
MANRWLIDKYSSNLNTHFKIKKVLLDKKTKFQRIKIFDLFDFGKSLVTDGITQGAQRDEFIYHDCLIHPALILQPVNKNLEILVLGAGEGATMRELLKYKNVKKITAVDIDGEAIKIFKKFFPEMHQGSFDNKRVCLVIDSAENFLLNTSKKYDVIFSDISDFTFFDLGSTIKQSEIAFYKLIRAKLSKSGFFVMHTSNLSEIIYKQHFRIKKILDKIFPKVYSYRTFVPFFADYWGFLISSQDNNFNPLKISTQEIASKIKKQGLGNKLKYFSPEMFKAIFALPPFFKNINKK